MAFDVALRWAVTAGALALPFAHAGASRPAMRSIEARVLDALQQARVELEVPSLIVDPALDRVARSRAERLAALAPDRRLADPWNLESDLEREGVTAWTRAFPRVSIVVGRDPTERIADQWRALPQAWTRAVDPATTRAGVGGAYGTDGSYVFVAVLLRGIDLPDDPAALERAVFEAVNAARLDHGLHVLVEDVALASIAREHSAAMRARRFFAHRDPDGRTVGDRADAAGIPYRRIAENIAHALRPEDPVAEVVSGWLGSPGHRETMLDPGYRRSGVGVALTPRGEVWFTQVFSDAGDP